MSISLINSKSKIATLEETLTKSNVKNQQKQDSYTKGIPTTELDESQIKEFEKVGFTREDIQELAYINDKGKLSFENIIDLKKKHKEMLNGKDFYHLDNILVSNNNSTVQDDFLKLKEQGWSGFCISNYLFPHIQLKLTDISEQEKIFSLEEIQELKKQKWSACEIVNYLAKQKRFGVKDIQILKKQGWTSVDIRNLSNKTSYNTEQIQEFIKQGMNGKEIIMNKK
ncbi:hypothetical protein [Candidatus Phytoplasma meliae]|uniref:Uncharacterized protein n=1 Tax=Candidatus Phytoplasma meliae TaxID=1848402 RepID=A0ABS5CYF4_9MOLU|nr:hypothetical protein [Candidatus Phytoplasma meliae]MBP5836004.1 hypothetical protein [Candidatus Phytoplasma meliae]